MTALTRLERYFGWIAIGNLPLFIVTTQAILYIWAMLNPSEVHLLVLDPPAVIYAHEYWRVLTFLFVTPVQNPIFAFFFLYMLYMFAGALETEWGSFSFTIFYLVGAIGTLAAAFAFGGYEGAFYLNTTIFLAFAAAHPNFQILLFFILPVKVKWLAVLTWLGIAYSFFMSPLPVKAAILISQINYFLFFGKTHYTQLADIIRSAQHRRKFKDWNP